MPVFEGGKVKFRESLNNSKCTISRQISSLVKL